MYFATALCRLNGKRMPLDDLHLPVFKVKDEIAQATRVNLEAELQAKINMLRVQQRINARAEPELSQDVVGTADPLVAKISNQQSREEQFLGFFERAKKNWYKALDWSRVNHSEFAFRLASSHG